jgi:hypothetical protein
VPAIEQFGEEIEEVNDRIIDLIEKSNVVQNKCYKLIQEKRYKEDTKLMKNIVSKVEVRIDDGGEPIFEKLYGMMLSIRTERNQIDKAREFLRRAAEDIVI